MPGGASTEEAVRLRSKEVINRLEKQYPGARIALNFSNPVELLVATMLSAQCTDKKVNEVTAKLFVHYRTVDDYSSANLQQLEQEVRPTGFYHNKARNIVNAARAIRQEFNGEVPRTMDELVTLPGVARKTANVVLYNAYGVVEGIAVDTHVRRVSKRLGLTRNDNPDKIEKDLMEVVPKQQWGHFSYLLIEHGRALCVAVRPRCGQCQLNDICPSAFQC